MQFGDSADFLCAGSSCTQRLEGVFGGLGEFQMSGVAAARMYCTDDQVGRYQGLLVFGLAHALPQCKPNPMKIPNRESLPILAP